MKKEKINLGGNTKQVDFRYIFVFVFLLQLESEDEINIQLI